MRKLYAMAMTLMFMVIKTAASPMTFLMISSFRNKSLRPKAFMAFRLAVWTGQKAYVKQNIRKKGTQGSHFSVSISRTMGSAHTASPIIIGIIMYVLILIALRVMARTRSLSSCSAAIAGNNTLSMDVLMFETIMLGK